jgi:hypothetical protein
VNCKYSKTEHKRKYQNQRGIYGKQGSEGKYTMKKTVIYVAIATGYGLDDRGVGVRVLVGLRIFSAPSHPDQLWGPPNSLPNGYRELFPWG